MSTTTIVIYAVMLVAAIAVFLIEKKKNSVRQKVIVRRPEVSPAEVPGRDIAKLVEPFSKVSVLLQKEDGPSTSYFAGMPPDYPDFVWPREHGHPLSFLGCIDLAVPAQTLDWLPKQGRLLFFYDMKTNPWGNNMEDREGSAVIYLSDPALISGEARADGWRDEWEIKKQGIKFKPVLLPPSWEEDVVKEIPLEDGEDEEMSILRHDLCGEGSHHLMGGYPSPIQRPDMGVQCEIVMAGLDYGTFTGEDPAQLMDLETKARDWELLLQIDTDGDLDLMWGDSGMIYFWVRRGDAERGDFSKTWLILQCH